MPESAALHEGSPWAGHPITEPTGRYGRSRASPRRPRGWLVSPQRRVAAPFAAAGVPSSPPSPLRDPAGSLRPSSHSPAAASERPARWPARAHESSRSPRSEARRHSCPARSPFLRRQACPLFGGSISTDGAVQSATKDAGGSSRSEARSARAALSAVRSEPSRASFAAQAEPLPSAVARRARGCSARARRCAIGRAPRLAAATLSDLAGLAAAEIRRSGAPSRRSTPPPPRGRGRGRFRGRPACCRRLFQRIPFLGEPVDRLGSPRPVAAATARFNPPNGPVWKASRGKRLRSLRKAQRGPKEVWANSPRLQPVNRARFHLSPGFASTSAEGSKK